MPPTTAANIASGQSARAAADLLQALRSAASADPDCTRFPRFGAHDDATLVWAQV
ncbi:MULTISPECIES: hypothetical protein [Pseudofrankia]|uniref:hypothetical protein n=1 Tax=Pseudofrankia TaxID=2994363 RepID=UPI0002E9C811|nr:MULTISPECIES: hypothetical protein [Pseudofrankia]